MRKHISLFLISLLFISTLTACAHKDTTEKNTTKTTEVSEVEDYSESDSAYEETTETSEESIQETESMVDFTEYKYTVTDNDGYVYEVTWKMTPWILTRNSQMVNSAWSQIGDGSELGLDFSECYGFWGLQAYSNGTYMGTISNYGQSSGNIGGTFTDMYYCMGTVEIKNVTNGWDFSENSVGNPTVIHLQWKPDGDTYGIRAVTKVYYRNKTQTYGDEIYVAAEMKSNSWGPVSFVIMAPENIAPKYPEGEKLEGMVAGSFSTYTDNDFIYVNPGVIDLNGTYRK